MKSKKPVIVGIGELLWDMFPEGRKVGGAPVNFAFHATSSGADGYAISAVGDDPLGDEILKTIEGIEINLLVEKVNLPTGTVQVTLSKGIPSYTITEGVAWDFIPFTERMGEIARITDAVCFGTLAQRSEISRNTIRTFLSQLPENAFKILDINLRAPFYTQKLIEESLRLCNILKLNDDELSLLKELFSLKETDDSNACKWLMDAYGLQYLILTAGADYSMVFTPADVSFLKTPKVKVVDTVGAGDSFTGAFIAALLKGDTIGNAHRAAVIRAAAVCQKAGAWVV